MKPCEKCNSNYNNINNITKWHNVNNWSSAIARSEWNTENLRNNLRNIWNGGEVRKSFFFNFDITGMNFSFIFF